MTCLLNTVEAHSDFCRKQLLLSTGDIRNRFMANVLPLN